MAGISLVKFVLAFMAIMLSIIFMVGSLILKKNKFKKRSIWLFIGTIIFVVLTTLMEFIYYAYLI